MLPAEQWGWRLAAELVERLAGQPARKAASAPAASAPAASVPAASVPAAKVLCVSLGRGQAAAELAAAGCRVTLWFLDRYRMQLAADALGPATAVGLVCSADFPDEAYDLVLLPLSHRGEAELARDWIQAGYQRLAAGGHLVVTVDHRQDKWVHQQLRALGSKVTVSTGAQAAGYVVAKQRDAKRIRSLQAEFTFRDGEAMLRAVSRPGVFAHRRLDPGAHQLIEAIRWPAQPPTGRLRGLEIGCGAGTITAALAARAQREGVAAEWLAIDSNARAVQCSQLTAAANGLETITAVLDCSGAAVPAGQFDLAIANPPYYADFRIARLFVQIAHRGLASGGTLYLVTKQPDWYHQNLFPGWRGVEIWPQGQYHIVRARRG